MQMKANEILESCLYVDHLPTAKQFYEEVLGLELVDQQEGRHLFWKCGRRMLLLFLAEASNREDSDMPRHGASGAGHAAFAVPDHDIPAWKTHLTMCGVPIEQELAWPQGGHSLYFRDPAGNSLELASPKIWGIPEHHAISFDSA